MVAAAVVVACELLSLVRVEVATAIPLELETIVVNNVCTETVVLTVKLVETVGPGATLVGRPSVTSPLSSHILRIRSNSSVNRVLI